MSAPHKSLPKLNLQFAARSPAERHSDRFSSPSNASRFYFLQRSGSKDGSPLAYSYRNQTDSASFRLTEPPSVLEASRMKNTKINEIVSKLNKKLNYMSKDKTKKFDEKIKPFENLATFIDVKDYLQQMNTLNPESARKALLKANLMTPRNIEEQAHESGSPTTKNARTARRQGNPDFGPFSAYYSQGGFLTEPAETRKTDWDEMEGKYRTMKNYLSRCAPSQDPTQIDLDSDMKTPNEKEKDRNDILLTQLSEMELRTQLNLNEDTDIHQFYQQLQNDLAGDKFDKDDVGNVEVQQEEFDYYKNLMAFKEEAKQIDIKYYEIYKARADKVLTLLRKATKNIYNKVSEKAKMEQYYSRTSTRRTTHEPRGRSSRFERPQEELKEKWKQHFAMLVASGKLMEDSNQDAAADLDAHFTKMLDKISGMKKLPKLKSQTKLDEYMLEEKKEKATTEDCNLNHEVNKAHKTFMRTILDCAKSNENKFKNSKEELKKKIVRLEGEYDRETQKLLPKNLESVRMTLDPNSASNYVNKPVRKHFSRKLLNAL